MSMNLKTKPGRLQAVMSLRIALNQQKELTALIALKCTYGGVAREKLAKAELHLDALVRDLNAIGEKDV